MKNYFSDTLWILLKIIQILKTRAQTNYIPFKKNSFNDEVDASLEIKKIENGECDISSQRID